MRLIAVRLAALACCLALAPAQAATVAQLEGHLAAKVAGRLSFEQETTEPDGTVRRARGTLDYLRPDLFRLVYAGELEIVSDGEELWIYDEALNQVVIEDLAASPNARGFLKILAAGAVGDEFSKRVSADGQDGLAWLELVPHDPDHVLFKRCAIAFDADGELVAVQVTDLISSVVRARFSPRPGSEPTAAEFTFTIPAGADVIAGDH